MTDAELGHALARVLSKVGGDGAIVVRDASSGDGYFEPYAEWWVATRTAQWVRPVEGTGPTPTDALNELATKLGVPPDQPQWTADTYFATTPDNLPFEGDPTWDGVLRNPDGTPS